MTLGELNAHYDLVQELHQAEELMQRLRAAAGLRAQRLTGMPGGSGASDTVGNMAVELAVMGDKIQELARTVEHSQGPVESWINEIPDVYTQMIFRLRYIGGRRWKEVADVIGGGNTEQSVKMLCYRYLGESCDAV